MKTKKLGELVDKCGALGAQILRLETAKEIVRARLIKVIAPGESAAGKRYQAVFVVKNEPILDAERVVKLLPRSLWPQVTKVNITRLREVIGKKKFELCVVSQTETAYLDVRRIE